MWKVTNGGSCKEEMNGKSLLLCEYLYILIFFFFLMFYGGLKLGFHQSSRVCGAVSLGVAVGLP
jgi:hypothetical protein